MHHRDRWPSLAWVWDELDDLRSQVHATDWVEPADYASLEDDYEATKEERDTLRTTLKDALQAIDDGADTARVADILAGAVE
jgi:hypothetical protein